MNEQFPSNEQSAESLPPHKVEAFSPQEVNEDVSPIEEMKRESVGENQEAIQVKEGVDFVFEQNPELATIGTLEQYSEYVESIFPGSLVKDIVYHYSSYDKIKEEGFKFFTETDRVAGTGNIEAIYFTGSKDNYWGGNDLHKYAAVLNIEHPLDGRNALSEDDDMVKEYESLMEEGGNREYDTENPDNKYQSQKNKKAMFTEKGYDSVLAPGLEEITVFHKESIHVLGSPADKEKFKQFVG